MKRTISTGFYQPNNNTDINDDGTDMAGEDTNNDPAPKPVPPTMHMRNATPDPIGPSGPSQVTPIQALGPITQPLLVSRGQTAESQQASESTQQISMQATDVNLAYKNGQTRLMLAAQDGDLTAVQALLSNGADVNVADEDGWTALMYASQKGHLTTVQALLGVSGINIDAQKSNGATALYVAAHEGKDDIVKALINRGANVNITNSYLRTPLMAAAEEGHLTTLQALLSVPGIDIDAQTSTGTTALYVAADEGKDDIVKALINKGANVNFTNIYLWTPLMAAAEEGHLTTVQALLSVPGIDIDAQTDTGATALYVAAYKGKNDVVKVLLENGADIKKVYESIKEKFDHHNDDSDDDENHNDDSDDDENHNTLSASLDFLMNYLAQRQADVGNLREEATWASAFTTSAIPPKASRNTIPSLGSIALDAHIKQAQMEGSSLSQISFQASRDQLLRQTLSAVDVVKLISTFSSSPFATALVQTLAIAIKLGGYRTESEHHLIFNALRTSHLIDEYEKSKSRLNSKNINRWQVSGQTLLTRAAQAGDQMLVDALVKCGASFHLPDQHGNNALHAAVKAHEWSVCSHLLELGANANTSDRNGASTLTYLAQAFAKEDEQTAIRVATLIAPLLTKGYRLDRVVPNPDSATPWIGTTILEILQSDLNRYSSYLDVLHADDVNLVDNDGNTPLMFAAKHGLLTVLRALMNKGAGVNAADNDGRTPLMFAAEKGDLAIVQALLSAPHIDINAKKPDGLTALLIAAIHGKVDVV